MAALCIALLIGIPAGVIAATHRAKPLDYGTMLVALVGISTPVFWSGIVLIYILSFRLGLFPIGGIIGTGVKLDRITDAYVLDSILTRNGPPSGPASIISCYRRLSWPPFPWPIIARMTRSSMLEVLGQGLPAHRASEGLACRNKASWCAMP